MTSRLTTVLFDLDDTLLDSWRARVAALDEALRLAGVREHTAEGLIRSLHGRQLRTALDEVKAAAGSTADLFTHYLHAYWSRGGAMRLFPGVREALESLQASGARLGVITQKERRIAIAGRAAGAATELEAVGIASLFGVTVGYEDVSRHKPDPEGVHLALERLGAQPEQTLLVGDSAADLQAGLAAGCWTCHAAWGLYPGHPGVDGVQPHAVAQEPRTVLGLVKAP